MDRIALIAGIVAIVSTILAAWDYFVLRKKRDASFIMKASNAGFSPHPAPSELKTLVANLGQLFTKPGLIKNVMKKAAGDIEIFLFEYQWEEGDPVEGATREKKGTVLAFCSQKLQLPYFERRPKRIIDKIGEIVGYKSSSMPAHEASAGYHLQSSDPSKMPLLFESGLFKLLGKGMYVGGAREWLVIADSKLGSIRPEEFYAYLDQAPGILSHLSQSSS